MMWAEDLRVGEELDLGTEDVSREDILAFAAQWDPMPFHVDARHASTTVFGDIIGSGVHTLALYQRLAVRAAYSHWAVVAGRAIRNVDLTGPLRPASTVGATMTIDAVTATSAGEALVSTTGRVRSADRILMTLQVEIVVRRRPVASAGDG